ncbi:ATP-dependent zinc metalloprotease FTSH 12, chloroplastic [Asimina triloba]
MDEEMDSVNAKYVVDFDMQEVEKSLRKDMLEKVSETDGSRALWIAKRWWHYRPKLPYTYFLQKLDCSEVAAVVFSEDLKKLYVTMKEGFPLEYVVDIPLDPYLFETINTSGVEVDLLQKRQIHYFLRLVIALAPGILILCLMKDVIMLLRIASNRYLYKAYKQLYDLAYTENFVMPLTGSDDLRSMSKEIVAGGDVWYLLDEIMMYMRNPLLYYDKEVQFVRDLGLSSAVLGSSAHVQECEQCLQIGNYGVIIYGPPGTGKTLFARTLAKESGIPFVFASGADFAGGESSGPAKVREVFAIARRNIYNMQAPSFIFVDEIDAIVGIGARRDRRRRAAFNALLRELDGEYVLSVKSIIRFVIISADIGDLFM